MLSEGLGLPVDLVVELALLGVVPLAQLLYLVVQLDARAPELPAARGAALVQVHREIRELALRMSLAIVQAMELLAVFAVNDAHHTVEFFKALIDLGLRLLKSIGP